MFAYMWLTENSSGAKIETVIINSKRTYEIMAGQKEKKLRDFPNVTLAGLELAILVKRHLIFMHKISYKLTVLIYI